ncbi:MAG: iron transporter permease [Modestobacter sp.]|nr:iron transporter permease [Modestobacter sp.]
MTAPPQVSPTDVLPPTSGIPKRQRWRGARGSGVRAWLVLAVVGSATLVPLALLLVNSLNIASVNEPVRYGLDNWRAAFADPAVGEAAWNTFRLGLTRTLIAVVIASILAWLIARTDMPGGHVAEILFYLAFFVPSISMTLGWILVLDPSTGVLNEAIRAVFGSESSQGPLTPYGFWGIIWVHLSSSTVPIITVLIIPAMRRMSTALEEAAATCGASRWSTARRITLPLMLPSLLGAALLGFLASLKAFEIELLLGVPVGLHVYSTQIYEWVSDAPPAYGIATALGAVFVPVMVVLAGIHRFISTRRSYVTVGAHTYSDQPVRLGKVGRWIVAGLVAAYIGVTLVVPLAAMVTGSLMRRFGFFELENPITTHHWMALFDDNLLMSSVRNSLVLGLSATVLGVAVYFSIAYIVVRSRLSTRGATDIMAWLPVALPGILLGLGLLWLYLGTPLRTVLYGNVVGLTLAIIIGHMAVGTQQMKAGLLQLSPDLEKAARVSGANPRKATLHVLLPLLGPTVAATAILTFDAAIRDISTVVLLSSRNSRPMSILLLEYSTGGELERAAAMGVLMSLVTVTVALVARRLTKGAIR